MLCYCIYFILDLVLGYKAVTAMFRIKYIVTQIAALFSQKATVMKQNLPITSGQAESHCQSQL